jgi:hypothetical protein
MQQKWMAGTCNKYLFLISGWLKRLTESREVNKWFENKKVHIRYRSWYSNLLPSGRYVDRIPVGVKFPAPVHNGPEAQTASYTYNRYRATPRGKAAEA